MTSDTSHFRLPRLSLRWIPIWRRNFLVWRKLFWSSLLGNLAEPIVAMVGLGFGLGALLPAMDGVPYGTFLALGMVVNSALIAAAVEALWSAFARMHVQKTWDGMLIAPLNLDDVVIGEWLWAASKSVLYSSIVLFAGWLVVGLDAHWTWLLLPPLAFFIGFCSAALALIVTSLARGWEHLMNFFMLAMMPMAFVSGVYFPVSQLPDWLQQVATVLPLWHAMELLRPLLLGRLPAAPLLHAAVLLTYAVAAAYVALVLFRRRLAS